MGEVWNSEAGAFEPAPVPVVPSFDGPMVLDVEGSAGKQVDIYNFDLRRYERHSRPQHTPEAIQRARDSMVTSDGKDIGEIPLSRMNRDALLLVADTDGITIAAGMTNHQIAEAIRVSREPA